MSRLAFALVCLFCTQASAAEQAPTDEAPRAQAPRRHARRRSGGQRLEVRVKLLTEKLDLDPKQQVEVKRLLERERQQILQVRTNTNRSAVDRALAIQAIGDKTSDQVRAMLNEEQKKKYPAARPPRDAKIAPQADVEHWMQLTRPKAGQDSGRAN